MSRMGSSCSMQRQYDASFGRRIHGGTSTDGDGGSDDMDPDSAQRSSMMFSLGSAIPNRSIASLYPCEDNYIIEPGSNHLRSPKTLTELACDTLCRSLPYLEGSLPPGIPQDVVDDVLDSLVAHRAINATTLRVLRNCELRSLDLTKCRGVSDAWLEQLCAPTTRAYEVDTKAPIFGGIQEHYDDAQECKVGHDDGVGSGQDGGKDDNDTMDLDHEQVDIFHGTFESPQSFDSTGSVALDNESFSTALQGDSLFKHDFTCSTDSHNMFLQESESLDQKISSAFHALAEEGGDEVEHRDDEPSPLVTSNITSLDLCGSHRLTDRGLLQLGTLTQVEVARLDGCHGVIGRGLVAFSSSHRLHTLSLANCRRLTDEAVINISHLLCLEALSLDGCRCLTDRSMAAIADLYALRKLGLSQCDLITDVGMEQLEHLESLEELNLGWCRQVTDHGIDCLTIQPGRSTTLRILGLSRCPITDVGLVFITRLRVLDELDLNGCTGIKSQALADTLNHLSCLSSLNVSYCPNILRVGWQGKIDKLTALDLRYSNVRDTHLSRLTKLPCLEELILDSCPVGDWAISHLADNEVVPNLTSLDLADSNLTDAGMVHIGKLSKLKKLSLFYCNITNRGLRHLTNLLSLEVLNIDSRDISDDGIRHLRDLKNLKALDLFSCRVGDTGCLYLSQIKSLETLEVCGGGVTDHGCTLLATLDGLTKLNLAQNERITGRGAAALAALCNLRALNLSHTRVTGSALRFFSGMLKLQSLTLYGCAQVPESFMVNVLRDSLPELKCIRRDEVPETEGKVLLEAYHSIQQESRVEQGAQDASVEMNDV